jgi:F-type H+-transporting ATPase subunit epsilon
LKLNFSYINYSNIAAKLLRRALKPNLRAEAMKRDETSIRFTPWTNGKPARKYPPSTITDTFIEHLKEGLRTKIKIQNFDTTSHSNTNHNNLSFHRSGKELV